MQLHLGGQMASALGLPSLDKSLLDDVVLPPGYRYSVLHATGDSPRAPSCLPTPTPEPRADDWSQPYR
jgi:uncharacterized protein